jgi:lipoprotein-anchoring transpeptidase ErfK/SrfK
MSRPTKRAIALAAVAACALSGAPVAAFAQAYAPAAPNSNYTDRVFEPALRGDQSTSSTVSPRFKRQVVDYPTREPPGTIVIDTPNTYLYLMLGGGKALRYGIGVGREGFTWSGVESISRTAEWPDWFPPPEMITRQPYLPRFMAGGLGNPLGARALYLGNSQYRIHGTNDPTTIGHRVSSGCIRLTNDDVIDLYGRVKVGTRVVVLPQGPQRIPVARASATVPKVIAVSTAGTRSDASLSFGLH